MLRPSSCARMPICNPRAPWAWKGWVQDGHQCRYSSFAGTIVGYFWDHYRCIFTAEILWTAGPIWPNGLVLDLFLGPFLGLNQIQSPCSSKHLQRLYLGWCLDSKHLIWYLELSFMYLSHLVYCFCMALLHMFESMSDHFWWSFKIHFTCSNPVKKSPWPRALQSRPWSERLWANVAAWPSIAGKMRVFSYKDVRKTNRKPIYAWRCIAYNDQWLMHFGIQPAKWLRNLRKCG